MEIKEIAQKALEARRQIMDAQMVLWNTRLEALVDSGDITNVLDHLQSPIEDTIDNCGCNVQCGALQEGLAANPVVRG